MPVRHAFNCLYRNNVPNDTGLQTFLNFFVKSSIPQNMTHNDMSIIFLCHPLNFLAFVQIRRDWFLQQQMIAGFHSLDGMGVMFFIHCANKSNVRHFGLRKKIIHTSKAVFPRHTIFHFHLKQPLWIDVYSSNNLHLIAKLLLRFCIGILASAPPHPIIATVIFSVFILTNPFPSLRKLSQHRQMDGLSIYCVD